MKVKISGISYCYGEGYEELIINVSKEDLRIEHHSNDMTIVSNDGKSDNIIIKKGTLKLEIVEN
ncbi:hypothetical protein [Bacillus mycoides]|uniref:hypothetical protein n=1 Tax=Bacillus mycoides TaxID=1405 RepID=UPI001C0139E8|nr:hypothetical protein [Bacillus mycoides]QWG87334.1 hypothetical protein EXW61_28875 [Bacillus mycoides]